MQDGSWKMEVGRSEAVRSKLDRSWRLDADVAGWALEAGSWKLGAGS